MSDTNEFWGTQETNMGHHITCHHHDLKWLTEQISCLPFRYRKLACDRYSAAFVAKIDETGGDESLARRDANTRLRTYIANVLSAY